MKRLFWLGLWALLMAHGSSAQQLIKAEYFFDFDPGFGNGTSINFSTSDSVNVNTNIPINGLSQGFHQLFVRVKDNLGKWSHYEGRMFYVIEDNQSIINQSPLLSGEYFFDSDPGLGFGNSINFAPGDSINITTNIPIGALSPGFHQLFIRVKNSNERWSHYEGRLFYIIPSNELTISQPFLIKGEYFFDSDPGVGNGTSFNFSYSDSVQLTQSIPISGLTNGVHYVYIRVKNNNGKWSHYEGRRFEVCNSLLAATTSIESVVPTSNFCQGHAYNFQTNSVNAGDQAIYLWTLNGIPVSTQSNYQNNGNLQNGDLLNVSIASSLSCVSPNPMQSNLSLNIIDTILHYQLDTICSGQLYVLPDGSSVNQPGTYYSYFMAGNSCDSTVVTELVEDICTGITSAGVNGLELYPNPSTGKVKLFNHYDEDGFVSVRNILGEILFSTTLEQNSLKEIKLTGLNHGLYFVTFRTASNKAINKMLIIE